MRILLTLFVFTIIMNTYAQNNTSLGNTGINKIDKNGKKVGVWKESINKDGILYTITNYSNGFKNGYYQAYYNNNKKAVEGFYINGKENGLFIDYFETGLIKAIVSYNNGLKEGWLYLYWQNGIIKDIEYYNKDKSVDGSYISYFDNGRVHIKTYKSKIRKGVIIMEEYNKKGFMIGQVEKLNDKIDGKYTYFDSNGRRIKEEIYKNGTKINTVIF